MTTEECRNDPTPCPQATAAAEHAVKTVFTIVGVNVDNPAEVEKFRDELRFNRSIKRVSDRTILIAITTIIGTSIAVVANKLGLL